MCFSPNMFLGFNMVLFFCLVLCDELLRKCEEMCEHI